MKKEEEEEENVFTGPGKIFFYLCSDAQNSLKLPARVVPTPLFLPIYVILTSFLQKLVNLLAWLTFTLFILTSLMVAPEVSNLGHSTSGTRAIFKCIYDVIQ